MNLPTNTSLQELIRELNLNSQDKSLREFDTTPDVKQLKENEAAILTETPSLIIKRRGKLYKVDLTEVT